MCAGRTGRQAVPSVLAGAASQSGRIPLKKFQPAALQTLVLMILGVSLLIAACTEGADKFFSGRPSEMAMGHNRIIGGPPEAMVELLRVPSRFPGATEAQVMTWQESTIVWWGTPEKHDVLVASFPKLSREESSALLIWVQVRGNSRSMEKAAALDAIQAAINAARGSS
jgi:hypothetical protein